MRDAEHQRRPLPPPSNDPEDIGPDHEGSEEEEEEEENEEEEEAGHGDGEAKSISSRKDKVVSSMSKASSKMVSSTRAKLRRTWDKVGHKKEEVSSEGAYRTYTLGFCGSCRSQGYQYRSYGVSCKGYV